MLDVVSSNLKLEYLVLLSEIYSMILELWITLRARDVHNI